VVDIKVEKLDDVNCRVHCDAGIAQELSEFFTFEVPNAKFSPSFKNGMWDGKIRLFNYMTRLLLVGLAPLIEKFAETRGYTVQIDPNVVVDNKVTDDEVDAFIKGLNLPSDYVVRDYQFRGLLEAINHHRRLLISPTASGKSLLIYLIISWFDEGDVLIIVPTKGLVTQMKGDFVEYGMNPDDIQLVMGGMDKRITKRITITTWQSAFDMPKSWFQKYRVMIGDEAHQFKAKSLTKLTNNLTNCPVKIGTTGTLDDSKTNRLVIQGMFGKIVQIETTSNMIDSGHATPLEVTCLLLQYPDEERQKLAKLKTYQDEIEFLITHPRRNKFIVNLAVATKGNTLVLFNQVEKHGVPLYQAIKAKAPDRNVYFVAGKVAANDREHIRKIVDQDNSAIIVASYGTFSTGINIKRLHNAIAAHPTKSIIRLLQSIGRILRLGKDKEVAKWFDIADDLAWKSWVNHTLKHFGERVVIYAQQKFKYKIVKVPI